MIPDTSVVQILGQNSSFELNGQTETVKSISGGGTNSRIDVGTGTLILNDLTGEVSTFQSQVIASSTGKIIKNGGGQINLTASSGSWDGEFVLNDGILGIGANNFSRRHRERHGEADAQWRHGPTALLQPPTDAHRRRRTSTLPIAFRP